ncbi:MAG: exo-alpha-sialidase [Phycisphaerales bacterium]|nr:MAG: exo-alpha-sialidase [Phycisphaerales bacterium]
MTDIRRQIFDILLVGLAGQIGGLGPIVRADSPDGPSGTGPASQTVLRVARSDDGLTFNDTGEVFLQHATAPDLVVQPDGRLLAIFDYAGRSDAGEPTVMAVSRSRDGGSSWSPARAIRFKGRSAGRLRGYHGDLMRMPGGRLRLYFLAEAGYRKAKNSAKSNGPAMIRSAVTNDGLNYHLDSRTRIRPGRAQGSHVMTAWIGKTLHLYTAGLDDRTAGSNGSRSIARHYVSPDGRRFVKLRSIQVSDADFVGSIVSTDDDLRAYVSTDRGIGSLATDNGGDWMLEPEPRLSVGWDPAVARLDNGSYLMLYCAAADEESPPAAQLVDASEFFTDGDDGEMTPDPEWAEDFAEDLAEQGAEDGAFADADDATGDSAYSDVDDTTHDATYADSGDMADAAPADGGGIGSDDAGGHSAASADAKQAGAQAGNLDPPDSEQTAGLEPGASGDGSYDSEYTEKLTGLEEWDPIATDGFAPLPDFKNRIDYFEWYREYALGHPEDNAYWAYASFMPNPPGPPGDPAAKPEWPELNDMFNSDYDGPPGPWDPADHPDWETSYQASQEVLELFGEATTHEGYASPPDVKFEGRPAPVEDVNLLIGILLPSLSNHRAMMKATMAAAWRLEDGRVSSKRMLQAFETSLRGANHIGSGATLIEDLVGIAERAQVQETARWALKHDVFSGDEIETALDTLREFDRDDRDPSEILRGEHAMCMDLTQYLYMPPGANGTPQSYKPERLNNVFDFSPEMVDRLARMEPDEVHASINAFDNHYRKLVEQFRIGYPEVRTADISAITEEYLHTTPLTDFLMPNLSRYYQLKTRSKASRRATQLAYATRLFKERNGRWPESLDELPPEHGWNMRIDPYSGDYFGYQLTDDGPKIYSASENGVDDGGVHSPRWADEIENDAGSDDYVFWPPQPRHKR